MTMTILDRPSFHCALHLLLGPGVEVGVGVDVRAGAVAEAVVVALVLTLMVPRHGGEMGSNGRSDSGRSCDGSGLAQTHTRTHTQAHSESRSCSSFISAVSCADLYKSVV